MFLTAAICRPDHHATSGSDPLCAEAFGDDALWMLGNPECHQCSSLQSRYTSSAPAFRLQIRNRLWIWSFSLPCGRCWKMAQHVTEAITFLVIYTRKLGATVIVNLVKGELPSLWYLDLGGGILDVTARTQQRGMATIADAHSQRPALDSGSNQGAHTKHVALTRWNWMQGPLWSRCWRHCCSDPTSASKVTVSKSVWQQLPTELSLCTPWQQQLATVVFLRSVPHSCWHSKYVWA